MVLTWNSNTNKFHNVFLKLWFVPIKGPKEMHLPIFNSINEFSAEAW